MGFTSTALSAGLLLGPVTGGVLYEYGGYFTVFLPALGLIAAEMIMRLIVIEGKRVTISGIPNDPSKTERAKTGVETDHPNGLKGVVPTPEGESQQNRSDQGHETASPTGAETQPFLPRTTSKINAYPVLLRSPRFMVAVGGLFVLNSIANGFDAVLPPYALDAFDLSPSHLALLFLVMGVPMFFAPISGALTDKSGPKTPATAGLVLLILSLFLLQFITPSVNWPFVKLMALLCCVGIAFAFAMPPLQTEVSALVENIELRQPGIFGPYGAYSQAYGLMNFAFAAGSMVGPLNAGFMRVYMGWSGITLMMAGLGAVVLAFVLAMTGDHGECGKEAHNPASV
ncbi:MAG: hypothetical protein Q9217_004931 [Psora testacea]